MKDMPWFLWILLVVNGYFAFAMIRIVIKRFQPGPKLFRESNRFHLLMQWYGINERDAMEEFSKLHTIEELKERNDEMEKEIRKIVKDYYNHYSNKTKK